MTADLIQRRTLATLLPKLLNGELQPNINSNKHATLMNWKQLLNANRPRPSSMGADHREQFERDYDRAIFSTPVKRLQDKAQVFPLEPHDAVRTRLTHSLEVSAVARGLAISVGKWLLEEKYIEPGMERQIEAIAGTCGLIHDLGNPPFGHAGEDAIRGWFKKRGEAKLREELKMTFISNAFISARCARQRPKTKPSRCSTNPLSKSPPSNGSGSRAKHRFVVSLVPNKTPEASRLTSGV